MVNNTDKHAGYTSFKSILLVFLVSLSSIFIIILSSNLDFFCSPLSSRPFSMSNENLFLIYSVIFAIINIYLLKLAKNIGYSLFKNTKILFLIAVIIQIVLTSLLFIIYGQMKIMSQYYNALFYAIIYGSLISSMVFLGLSGFLFLRWYKSNPNYLVLTYGIVMAVLLINSVIGAIYMSQVSSMHSPLIKRTSCSVMIGSLGFPHPQLANILANFYDITSLFSFVLIWIVTVIMLKQYSKGIRKVTYWIIVSLPLIFFLSRYEIALYYFTSHQLSNVLSTITLSPEMYGYKFFEIILNLNLQLGGILFGIAFFTIATRITPQRQQRYALILTGVGIMFLFASKDIGVLIISSYPPLGGVSVSFIGLASYLTFVGIYSAARTLARNKDLRTQLHERVEKDVLLLKSIARSQDHIDTERNVRHLMDVSSQWQIENKEHDMSKEDMLQAVKDVISELRKSKK